MKRLLGLALLVSALGSSVEASVTDAMLDQLVYEIRDPQTGPYRFRKALEKIGEYLALNVLEELETTPVKVETLTGAEATHALVSENPVLVTILRAGLPLNAGVQKVFPHSQVGFLAMSRDERL